MINPPTKFGVHSETGVFPSLDCVSNSLPVTLRDFWRLLFSRAAAHSDCCFFAPCTNILTILTYLLTHYEVKEKGPSVQTRPATRKVVAPVIRLLPSRHTVNRASSISWRPALCFSTRRQHVIWCDTLASLVKLSKNMTHSFVRLTELLMRPRRFRVDVSSRRTQLNGRPKESVLSPSFPTYTLTTFQSLDAGNLFMQMTSAWGHRFEDSLNLNVSSHRIWHGWNNTVVIGNSNQAHPRPCPVWST